ncbi:hypothetical protein MSWHS_1348 [Methanosarcina sp. WWM596]|nr:hypothetical protein MSWHS_1348 [Methanosarcina sp. WWM596]
MKCATMHIIIIIMLLFGTGCIGDGQVDYNLKNNSEDMQTDYNLQYDFNAGDIFVYNITHSTENSKNIIPTHIEMLVSDFDGTNITTNVTSIKTISGNTTKSSYTAIMDVYGNLMKAYPEIKIIPEIQPELPNLIVYPKKAIQEEDSWTIIFNNTLNNTSSGILYEVIGTKNYTCVGLKTISTKAGRFECVGIKSDSNFASNTTTETNGTAVCIITRGKLSGIDWVDLKDGFLVKSEYDIDTVMTTDLPETYKEIGFENFSRETPVNLHMVSYLENIKKG